MHADIRLSQVGHPGDGVGPEHHRLSRVATVRTPYGSPDGFRFLARRRDVLDRLLEPLRFFRLRVADPRLRTQRYFSTNDRGKLSELLAGAGASRDTGADPGALRTLLLSLPDAVLEVRSPMHWSTAERQAFPDNVLELSAERPGGAGLSELLEMLELSRTALTALHATGSAIPL